MIKKLPSSDRDQQCYVDCHLSLLQLLFFFLVFSCWNGTVVSSFIGNSIVVLRVLSDDLRSKKEPVHCQTQTNPENLDSLWTDRKMLYKNKNLSESLDWETEKLETFNRQIFVLVFYCIIISAYVWIAVAASVFLFPRMIRIKCAMTFNFIVLLPYRSSCQGYEAARLGVFLSLLMSS